ncbi:MAG: hypothetical protein IT338_19265 [Thermomicrobiales bacterium]|nr:hypothetical protein [Thermomicrobiales bacterium]
MENRISAVWWLALDWVEDCQDMCARASVVAGVAVASLLFALAPMVEAQYAADCSAFATYEEAQNYLASNPGAAPIIDPNYDGRACEVWFGVGAIAPSSSGQPIVRTDFGGLDGIDYDCWDFATQGDAQAYFERDGGSVYNNADGLDRNHNGLACEPGEFD